MPGIFIDVRGRLARRTSFPATFPRSARTLVGWSDASEAPPAIVAVSGPRGAGRASRTGTALSQRRIQLALGVLWLVDGLLQFQSYMYTQGFVREVLAANAARQPAAVGAPILALAGFYGRDLTLWNTLAAELQCAIGLGLIVGRRWVRPALAASFAWCLVVWWVGEGLAQILTANPLSPLMGAPGAAVLYGLVGLLAWPSQRGASNSASRARFTLQRAARSPSPRRVGATSPAASGPLGDRGGLVIWSALWIEAAALWVTAGAGPRTGLAAQLRSMGAMAPAPLAGWDRALAGAALSAGADASLALAIISAAIGLVAWTRMRWAALAAGVALSLAYWVFGQLLGGPFWSGTATDVNSAPLFVVLAGCLLRAPAPRWRRALSHRSAATVIVSGCGQPSSAHDETRSRLGQLEL
jgi:hypothetical protein